MIAWTVASSFTQMMPVPGRTVSNWGTNELFWIWNVVILVEAICTGMGVFTAVATVVAIAVVFGGVVATVVGCLVGAGVATVGGTVGTTVLATVVWGTVGTTVVTTVVVTAAGCAGWVHPLIITRPITRINNPMNFFMEIRLFLSRN